MRTPILTANWKMNKTIAEALDFARPARAALQEIMWVRKVICAPFMALPALAEALRGSGLQLGAQDMHWEDQGAFTGEISPLMLKEVCELVIIGHSERRQFFGETDETVNRKIKAALAHELTPIVCVGESLAQNQAGQTEAFVSAQMQAAFEGISAHQAEGIIVAYEPIWAIGTGLAATAEDANRIIGGVVRASLAGLYGAEIAGRMRIQYGGSMNTKNVEELMRQPEIDGGLVGGASLNVEDFISLVKLTASAKGLA